jgi:hypothetical protein
MFYDYYIYKKKIAMKKKLLLSLIPFYLFSQSITIDEKTGLYSYSEILEFDNKTKSELFTKCNEWIALQYRSANDVIQFIDKDNGKIIAKGIIRIVVNGFEGNVRHTLIIDTKDNKVRATYTNFIYYAKGVPELNFEKKFSWRNKVINETETKVLQSIKELTNYIEDNNESDW